MRPPLTLSTRALLTAVALLCLHAQPSLASTAHGLECTALGAATVTSSADQQSMVISNIGPTGSDGTQIALYGADGHSVGVLYSVVWDHAADLGARLSYEWTCVSGTCSHSCTMTRTSDGLLLQGSLVSGGVVPRKLYLYDGDHLRSFDGLYFSSGLEVSLPSSSPIPAVTIERDGKRDLAFCSVSFSSLVTINGVQCDRVVVASDASGDPKLDFCRLTCTNPPGGSLGTVTISSQSLLMSGRQVSCEAGYFSPAPSGSQFKNVLDSDLGSECRIHVVATPFDGVDAGTPLTMMHFVPGTMVLTPGTDEGAMLRCEVAGNSSCSPDGVVASLTTLVRSSDVLLSSHFSSMCADAESVIVLSGGASVLRQAVALDGSVTVTAPTGDPVGMAIASKGAPAEKPKPTKPKPHFGEPVEIPENATTDDHRVVLQIRCQDAREFAINGNTVIGDIIEFVGERSSVGLPPMELTGTNFVFSQSSSSHVPNEMVVQQVTASGGDQVSAETPSSALSLGSSVVQVPVVIDRVDATPARGYSVTLELSSNLCLASSVVEYDYLSSSGTTQMFVTPEGSNRYAVDCVLMGAGCGPADPSGSGTLFTIPVSVAPGAPDGTGTVSIESVALASCDNDPLPCAAGGTAFVVIDRTSPPAPTGATATQVTTGNQPGSTTAVWFKVTLDGDPLKEEAFRAPYGTGPGSVPVQPTTYPPPAPWTLVTSPAPGYAVCYSVDGACWTDRPPTRDFYYYVAYAKDRYGNPSPASTMTPGTLDYHLGDNTDGVTTCSGDNQVDGRDVSALGAFYGATITPATMVALSCLDVGPTSDHHVSGRPLKDMKLNFEDIMLYAINFLLVSTPADRVQPVAAATNSVRLLPATIPAVGGTFDAVLAMTAAGDLQGLSAQLDYDPAMLEWVSVSRGELIGRQDREGVVLSANGSVDAALLGQGAGLSGEGELARVRFRVRAVGDPHLGIAGVDGRDGQNQSVPIALLSSPAPPSARTAIRWAYPDPFDRETRVEFTLPQRAPVKVGVFDVAGRRVRTLLDGVQDPGVRTASWDGRDESGARREAGVYMIRIETAGARETRTVRLVR